MNELQSQGQLNSIPGLADSLRPFYSDGFNREEKLFYDRAQAQRMEPRKDNYARSRPMGGREPSRDDYDRDRGRGDDRFRPPMRKDDRY